MVESPGWDNQHEKIRTRNGSRIYVNRSESKSSLSIPGGIESSGPKNISISSLEESLSSTGIGIVEEESMISHGDLHNLHNKDIVVEDSVKFAGTYHSIDRSMVPDLELEEYNNDA
ncbi:hypothetical protein Tco_0474766 [Tanacetum coccineum]